MTKPLMYPVKKVGKLLGVGRSTVFDLMRRNEIERVKIGRRTLILSASLYSFIDRQQKRVAK